MDGETVSQGILEISAAPSKGLSRFTSFILASIPTGLVLCIAWYGVYTFVNGYLVKGLGLSNESWTAATLWFSGGMIVWSIVCPEISSLIGRRKTVALSMLLAAGFYLVVALTANLTLIRVLLFLMGFVAAANNVAWLPIVTHVGRERPGRILAMYQFLNVSVGAALLIGGGSILAKMNYRVGFIVFSVVCLLCAVMFYMVSAPFESDQPEKVISFRRFTRRDFAGLASRPFLMVMAFGFCMEPFNYHTMNQLYPNLVRDHFGLGDQWIGTIVSMGRLPALGVLLLLGSVVDRRNILRLYPTMFLLAASVIAILGLQTTLPGTIAFYLIFYIFHGGVWATNLAAIYSTIDRRLSDAAFAVMSVLATLAVFGVGVVHNRLLVAGFSLSQVFCISGLCAAAGALTLIGYSFKKRNV